MNYKTPTFIWTILLILFSFPIFSQTEDGFDFLAEEEYENAIEAFQEDLEDKTMSSFANYGMAKIYADTNFSEYNIDTAWMHYLAFNETYKSLSTKKKDKYKKPFKIKSVRLKNQITEAAIEFAKTENTVEAYDHFLVFYKKSKASYRKDMELQRNQLAYDEAKELNTSIAFRVLEEKYYKSFRSKSPKLLKEAQLRFFELSMKENGWDSYDSFAKSHSKNPYVKDSGSTTYRKIHSLNDKEKYREFLDNYPRSLYLNIAKNQLVKHMMEDGPVDEYNWFLLSYPDHESASDLWKKFHQVYLSTNGNESIREFAEMYPQYPFQDDLKKELEIISKKEELEAFAKIQKTKNVKALLSFWEENPNSNYIPEIDAKIIKIIGSNSTISVYEKYLSLNPETYIKERIVNQLYQLYSDNLTTDNLNKFKNKYGSIFSDPSRLENDFKLADRFVDISGRTYDGKQKEEFSKFISDAAPHRAAYEVLFQMINEDLKSKNWSKAKSTMKEYHSIFENKSVSFNQLYYILNSPHQNVQLKKLSAAINTKGSEFAPAISANGKTLYFCAKERVDNVGKEDIYISTKENNQWTPAKLLRGINSASANEAPEAISVDGTQLMMFRGGRICFSNRTFDGWSELEYLPKTINATRWQADATISSDGRALLFTSERPDIVGFKGKNNLDIYVALKNDQGEWEDVINLGTQINTPFLDRSAFLHPDMETLYFSSAGHGGLGEMDVYKTTRLDDTWQNWSTPINLGKEINTSTSDWGYKVSTDGKIAYFSFAENGSKSEDIYQVNLPPSLRPQTVSTISGWLKDSYDLPLDAEIVIEDLETGEVISELKSNPETGEFFVVLPGNRKYSYYIKKENYFPISNNIDLTNNQQIEIKENLELFTVAELTEKGMNFTLQNIFFDTNKSILKKESHSELNRVFALIKTNNFKVELQGHTDSDGDNQYNTELSQRRADAVMNYLIEKGIPTTNITAVGKGESKPIESNKTIKGKAKNRRVEIQFKN